MVLDYRPSGQDGSRERVWPLLDSDIEVKHKHAITLDFCSRMLANRVPLETLLLLLFKSKRDP